MTNDDELATEGGKGDMFILLADYFGALSLSLSLSRMRARRTLLRV